MLKGVSLEKWRARLSLRFCGNGTKGSFYCFSWYAAQIIHSCTRLRRAQSHYHLVSLQNSSSYPTRSQSSPNAPTPSSGLACIRFTSPDRCARLRRALALMPMQLFAFVPRKFASWCRLPAILRGIHVSHLR